MRFGQVATIAAILLIAASTAMAHQLLNPKTPPSPEAYIADQNAGLDAVEASIAGLEGKKLLFAGVLYLAHGQIIAKMPLDVLIAYADALKEAGVERVDIYTTQSAWPDKIPADIAKYDAVIEHIRRIGLKLGFDPTADPHTLKGGYAQWKPWAIAAYTEMARRYQPEKFSVMHEPTAMDMSLREKVSPATWAAFATQACAAIAAVSPHTVCTVALLPFERAEFDALIKVPAIKSIGFDIFGDGHDLINYDNSGLRHQIDELATLIKAARAAGKSLHIAETGRQIWDFMDLMSGQRRGKEPSVLSGLQHRRSALYRFGRALVRNDGSLRRRARIRFHYAIPYHHVLRLFARGNEHQPRQCWLYKRGGRGGYRPQAHRHVRYLSPRRRFTYTGAVCSRPLCPDRKS